MSNKNYYRNNKSTGENGRSRRRFSWGPLIVIIAAASLFCTALVSGLAFISDGFTNKDPSSWFERELNPDNLIKKENYSKQFPEDLSKEKGGLKFNIKDDGTIVLSGLYKDEQAADVYNEKWALTSVTLPAGKYTLSAGNDSCGKDKFGLYVEIGNKAPEYVHSDDLEFELTEETNVMVSVFVNNGERFFGINSYIRPILVSGDAAVEFYK